jgi:hypothetical protein
MCPEVFRLQIEGLEVSVSSRDCQVSVRLTKPPPDAWIQEFQRSSHAGPSASPSKTALKGNTVVMRVPKIRRAPVDEEHIEHEFRSLLNRIRGIDRRFLIFEDESGRQEMDAVHAQKAPASDPVAESIQKKLDSILSDWQNDSKHYFKT